MTDIKESVSTENNEFGFLLRLLDDEDENIYTSIRERFLSYGNNSSDFLKHYLNDENVLIKKRAKEIVSIINFETIEEKFKKLSLKKRGRLLEDASLLLASLGYPEVNMNSYKRKLDRMADDIENSLMKMSADIQSINPLDKINVINNYLFYDKHFRGNSDDYYSPDNSYLNKVIDTGLGIPISLSLVYILIARRLDLPVYGINLPGHFIIKYSGEGEEFFIDPFNSGVIISMSEAKEFIKKLGLEAEDVENIPYLKETSDVEMILRMMRNLADIYTKNNDPIKTDQLERLMQSLV